MSAPEGAADRTAPRAALALFGATLTIALSSVLVRRSYGHGGTPESVIVLRTGTPAVLLGLIVAFEYSRGRLRGTLSRGLVLRLVALGCCLLGGSMGELYSLARLRAPIAILFFALAPLWIALLSRALYGTRLGGRRAAGLVIALTGVVVVVGVPSGHVDPLGAAFAMGGGFAASGSFLLLEGGLATIPARLVWAIALGEAALVSLVLNPSAPSDLARHPDVLAMALGAGVLAGFAQLLATFGVRAVGAIVAGIATALEPVNTAVIAWLVLGETVGIGVVAGGVVVLFGVLLTLTAPPLVRRRALAAAPVATVPEN
jgi:drug/metabolite transporter (DMT)-like permease